MKQPLLAFVLSASVSAQVVIDNFSDGDFLITSPSVVAGQNSGTMMGGVRQYLLAASSGPSSSSAFVSDGVLTFNKPDQNSVIRTLWGYYPVLGDFNFQPAAPLHLDATQQAVSMVISANSFSTPLEIAISLIGANGNVWGVHFHNVVGTGTLTYFPNADSDIAAIELQIPNGNLTPVGSITIDSLFLTTVPEPATYASLCGLGLVGLATLRRICKKPSD